MTMLSRRYVLQALGAGALLAPFGLQACLEPLTGKASKVSAGGSDAKPDLVADAATYPDLVAQDAWDGGAPDTSDGGAPDTSDGSAPDTSDGGTPDTWDGGASDAWGGDAPDTWEQFQDVQADVNKEIETQLDTGGVVWPLVIQESFQVYLGDTACSNHMHICFVEAGTYTDNALVQVKGGHPMALRPLEMKSLEQGGQIPYHTLPHGSHHHCGTAIRWDLFKSEFDSDVAKLDDFFQCVVPKVMPEDTPEPWVSHEYGPCSFQ
jgi:hypothetical protein